MQAHQFLLLLNELSIECEGDFIVVENVVHHEVLVAHALLDQSCLLHKEHPILYLLTAQFLLLQLFHVQILLLQVSEIVMTAQCTNL